MGTRDQQRRRRVEELVADGRLSTGDDYFHAAMVLQHGSTPDSYWSAHQLAKKAVERGDERGRWLAAAAYDRWLVGQGQPQKYGTQYRAVGARWVLCPVDPRTTDDERVVWNVPPLRAAEERAEQLSRENPPAFGVGFGGLEPEAVAFPSDDDSLEGRFQLRCRDLVIETRALGFNPNVWVTMINELGALGAAKRLLADGHVLVATPWLVARGRGDLTLEHEIAQGSWSSLFTDEERADAARRLGESERSNSD